MRPRWFIALVLAALPCIALPHPSPNSTLRLKFGEQAISAEYWLPISELAFASPGTTDATLSAYLVSHLAAQSPGGPWEISVKSIRKDQYLEHDFLVADIRLRPPPGGATRPLVITNDAITHEVRNHVVFVVESGGPLLGILQYPARRVEIAAP